MIAFVGSGAEVVRGYLVKLGSGLVEFLDLKLMKRALPKRLPRIFSSGAQFCSLVN